MTGDESMHRIKFPWQFFRDFPGLLQKPWPFQVTSNYNKRYNCIAHAMDDKTQPWWPVNRYPYFWPSGCEIRSTLAAFTSAFATKRYKPCEDGCLEKGQEKVALYSKGDRITHAAKQKENGRWSSKMGDNVDIEHDLPGVECQLYGQVVAFFSRPRVPDLSNGQS